MSASKTAFAQGNFKNVGIPSVGRKLVNAAKWLPMTCRLADSWRPPRGISAPRVGNHESSAHPQQSLSIVILSDQTEPKDLRLLLANHISRRKSVPHSRCIEPCTLNAPSSSRFPQPAPSPSSSPASPAAAWPPQTAASPSTCGSPSSRPSWRRSAKTAWEKSCNDP